MATTTTATPCAWRGRGEPAVRGAAEVAATWDEAAGAVVAGTWAAAAADMAVVAIADTREG